MHSGSDTAVNRAVKRECSGRREHAGNRAIREVADVRNSSCNWGIEHDVVNSLLPRPGCGSVLRDRHVDRVEADCEHANNPVTRSADRSAGAPRTASSSGPGDVGRSAAAARCERRHKHCGNHQTLSRHSYAPVRKVR